PNAFRLEKRHGAGHVWCNERGCLRAIILPEPTQVHGAAWLLKGCAAACERSALTGATRVMNLPSCQPLFPSARQMLALLSLVRRMISGTVAPSARSSLMADKQSVSLPKVL